MDTVHQAADHFLAASRFVIEPEMTFSEFSIRLEPSMGFQMRGHYITIRISAAALNPTIIMAAFTDGGIFFSIHKTFYIHAVIEERTLIFLL